MVAGSLVQRLPLVKLSGSMENDAMVFLESLDSSGI